jgi:hypothetical protein
LTGSSHGTNDGSNYNRNVVADGKTVYEAIVEAAVNGRPMLPPVST